MSIAVRMAQERQRRAADPGRSVVLEAAAGSGKTTVLVDRFLRLCLADPGVDPRAILAITFTRKATLEIMERLQRQARRLARLSGAALDTALAEILRHEPSREERARAAWFHECLLVDPAGLGIDTLHAFCQKVLGRFAGEAGLDPRFAILDERQEEEYRAHALDGLEAQLSGRPDRGAAFVGLTGSPRSSRALVASMFQQRVHLYRWLDRVAPPPDLTGVIGRRLSAFSSHLVSDLQAMALAYTPWVAEPDTPRPGGLPDLTDLEPAVRLALLDLAGPGLDTVRVVDEEEGFTRGFRDMEARLQEGVRAALAGLDQDPPRVRGALQVVQELLLKADRQGLRQFPGRRSSKLERQTAFARAAAPFLELALLPLLGDLLSQHRRLIGWGLEALDSYGDLKRRDRVVDFQDLEYLALRLMTDRDLGPQVHFRLDARLDHLLLDEFQDTNRNQWELLRPLLEELLAGGQQPRSVFVVGDVKQSIYGFRGADPKVFAEARDLIIRRCDRSNSLILPTNFRSLHNLVNLVGHCCNHDPLRGYLGTAAAGAEQQAARTDQDGTAYLISPLNPDDLQSGHDRAAALTVEIVQSLLATGTQTWDWDTAAGQDVARDLTAGDILILARNKSHLASYEAALRHAGIPYTPAGRGLLARSREVQDLLALLRWLILPADDVAGATVLRSPWFRVPEATVQSLLSSRLAGPRRRSLRQVFRAEAAKVGLADVGQQLEAWWSEAGLLPLHDLLRRLLREGDLLARAELAGGEQARYNLLRLLDLALAADQRGGSLRDFVHELELADQLGGEDEGALPGESGAGRVRVMTIHGSKGLEAPVVILVDAAVPLNQTTDPLLLGPRSVDPPWLTGVPRELTEGYDLGLDTGMTAPLAVHRERALAALWAEEAHVLYVAMTRARDRLYILGGRNRNQNADQDARSYLGWLRDAAPAEAWTDADTLRGDLVTTSTVTAGDSVDQAATRIEERIRPWIPPVLTPRIQVANPSTLDDDHHRPDPADQVDPDAGAPPPGPRRRETDATRRGTRIHAWLERACRLGAMPPPPDDPERRVEWEEARAVYEADVLAWVAHPEQHGGRGFSEVDVIGADGDGGRVIGIIDRLVIRPDRVDIIDYKSNRLDDTGPAPLVEHYRPQLAAYRSVLAELYPDRTIRCWLLWTRLATTDPAGALSEVGW